MASRRNCRVFVHWNEGRVGFEEWAEHRERCPVCRAQSALDSELRQQLGTLPRPHLSPEFQRRLLSQVEPGRHAADRKVRGWMYGYWLAAGVASFFLLARVQGAGATWSAFTLLAVAALAAALVRGFGVDPVELVWWAVLAPAGTRGSARAPLRHGNG